MLGKLYGKFDFKVKYTASPSASLKKGDIMPSRWGDKFDKEDEIITVPLPNMSCVMEINIWYDYYEELSVNHVTRSGRVYSPAEKDMVQGKEVAKKLL